MGKKIKIELDIDRIVEFDLNEKQRIELVDYILTNLITYKGLQSFTRKFIKDIKSTEEEFEMRKEVIDACNVLINNLK